MKRQITRRDRARVEVLVIPASGRHKHTGFVPGHDDPLAAGTGPHDRVAIAGRDDDDDAGSMMVSLLVAARWEHGHVRWNERRREFDGHVVAATTSLLVGIELIPGRHVREEVAEPHRPAQRTSRPI